MLDNFIDHLYNNDNKSLIGRIYGVFTIKTNFFAPIDIIIMQNTILRKEKSDNLIVFDLKGNTRNRKLKPSDIGTKKFWLKKLNHKACFRDLNFNEMRKDLKGKLVTLKCDKAR